MKDQHIELPPLPRGNWYSEETKEDMQAYARAAIEADRQRRGEPVAYMVIKESGTGHETGLYRDAANKLPTGKYLLYLTAPQPAELASDEELREAISNYGDMRVAAYLGETSDEKMDSAWDRVTALLARYGAAPNPESDGSDGGHPFSSVSGAQPITASQSCERMITTYRDFIEAVRHLCVIARTSGGTAGRDEALCAALDRVEAMVFVAASAAPVEGQRTGGQK